jgi:agmatine/peptidylarginine deiminase
MTYRLLPEWEPQDAVLLAWPDANTDWRDQLDSTQACYLELIHAINRAGCTVLLLIKPEEISAFVDRGETLESVVLIAAQYNDTWLRDYGFLTLGKLTRDDLSTENSTPIKPIEFQFNGWGNKFNAAKDNQVNQRFLAPLLNNAIATVDLVCEGGALEIDSQGRLLSTRQCLSNPERNGDLPMADYVQHFKDYLGATQVIILDNGHLQGDDTDGHIDTLVRFTPTQGLVVQSCFNATDDSHYHGLSLMVDEVATALPDHKLFELPLARVENSQGDRLPASYANYLICNGHILCPTYRQPEDQQAMAIVGDAHPGFEILAIDCWPLVQQFGSLHCVTMQVPKGTLKPEVTALFNCGVKIL